MGTDAVICPPMPPTHMNMDMMLISKASRYGSKYKTTELTKESELQKPTLNKVSLIKSHYNLELKNQQVNQVSCLLSD